MFDKEQLIESYKEFYGKNGRFPEDAEEFARYLGLEDASFLRSFNPLNTLEVYIWEQYFDAALKRSQAEPSFSEYASREVYLSLLFNVVGLLSEDAEMNRDMVSFSASLPSSPKELKLFKRSAEAFFSSLIEAGKSSGEIASRPLVEFQYKKWCWWGLLFIVYFWKNDDSRDGEQTDVAVEKTAHMVFDMLNPNALDSSLEFFSFLFKKGFK